MMATTDKYHIFHCFEVSISQEEREELCVNVLKQAANNNIQTEPHIKFVQLRSNIANEMENLSKTWKFQLKNSKNGELEEVSFAVGSVMFTESVLKNLFSKRKKGALTLQAKNLDILSFYVNAKPWQKNNSVKNSTPPKWLSFGIMFFVAIALLICAISLAVYHINIVNNYEAREALFQKGLMLAQVDYYEQHDINYHNLIDIPDSTAIICQIYFSSQTKTKFPDGFEMKVIKNPGDFIEEPGIKLNDIIGTEMAFGFGRTSCANDCYEANKHYLDAQNTTILRLIPPKENSYVSYIKFKWVETGIDNGSTGYIYINEEPEPLSKTFIKTMGILPTSHYLIDPTPHDLVIKIDKLVNVIDIVVFDIANRSEIYINKIQLFN